MGSVDQRLAYLEEANDVLRMQIYCPVHRLQRLNPRLFQSTPPKSRSRPCSLLLRTPWQN